jgi:hypothetical protein
MQQVYHSNATTNHNIRKYIQLCPNDAGVDLVEQFNASNNTISKWKARGYFEDASSRPYYIQEALTDIENALINRCKSIFKFGKYKLKLLFGIGYK